MPLANVGLLLDSLEDPWSICLVPSQLPVALLILYYLRYYIVVLYMQQNKRSVHTNYDLILSEIQL